MVPAHPEADGVVEAGFVRRIRLLVAATITWNLLEVVVALWAGAAASSPALVGFGLDSVLEVCSALALGWQFTAGDRARRQARERGTLRVIGVLFLLLACWITVAALACLTGDDPAQPSVPGLLLTAASLPVMAALSTAQRRAGQALGSHSATADARQGTLCAYLSGTVLVGLIVNGVLGWSWADPIAALAVAAVAAKEGRGAWRGKGCCTPGSMHSLSEPTPADHQIGCACCA